MSEEEINEKTQELVDKIEILCSTYTQLLESNEILKISDIDKATLINFTSFCIDLKNLYFKEKEKAEEYRIGWCNAGEELEKLKKELEETKAENKFDKGLYGLYVKEQEKNMQLNQKIIMYKNRVPNQYNFFDYSNYIHKDKIKELLENELINISGFECIAKSDIEELLEDK